MKFVIATRNPHKLEEIKAIFRQDQLEVLSSFDFPDIPDVIEDGDTFEANAVKKAVALARATGFWALADDSGLEVDALNGEPGVYSARYAGEAVSYEANNEKLLKNLSGITDRTARFRCVIALSSPSGITRTVDGRCEGKIALEAHGAEGFGYDPLFVPEGHETTFAEMTADDKNAISHRGRALKKAEEAWGGILTTSPLDWPK